MIRAGTADLQHKLAWLACAVTGFIGAGMLWYATRWGVGASPDSAEYLAAANRLHDLKGLLNLPSQWAPGYPVLLKLASLAGSDLFASTRVLQALLLAANLVLALRLLRQATAAGATLFAAGLPLLVAYSLWEVNFYAWSEGPYLLCVMLSSLALLDHVAEPRRQQSLYLAGAAAALALLFRYAGLSWVGAGGLFLLWRLDGDWRRRLRGAVIFGCTAVLPFVLWLLVNKLVRNETTNRQLVVHGIAAEEGVALLQQIGSWLGLVHGPLVFAVVLTLAIIVWVRTLRDDAVPAPLRHLLALCLVHIGVYVAFILVSKALFDAYIPFDDRIFVPASLFMRLSLFGAALFLLGRGGRARGAAIALLAVMTLTGAFRLLPAVQQLHEQGAGYFSAYMAQVSDVKKVKQLEGRAVYSNAPDYLRMQTELDVHDLPRKYAPTTLLPNPAYAQELETMQHAVQAGKALLVYYQGFEWRLYFPTLDDLTKLGYEGILSGSGVQVLSYPVERPPATDGTAATNQ